MASVEVASVWEKRRLAKDEGRASRALGDGGWDGMKGRKMDVRRGIVTEESWSCLGWAFAFGFWPLQARKVQGTWGPGTAC
jgi:hypothetical protein